MKKIFKSIALITLAAFITSCDSKSKLADDVSGTWSSSPEKLIDNDASSASITKIIEFIKTPEQSGGELILSGLISITTQLPQSPEINQPISYSASGVATIQGEWSAQDDDEIAIFLNAKTLSINVDPQSVVLKYDILTQTSAPDTAQLKPAMAESIKAQISHAVETQFFNAKKIDDIKIKDNIMSCEINDRDLTLRRQIVD